MGTRVARIYDKYSGQCGGRYDEAWENCCCALRSFSSGIDQDFKAAFCEMVDVAAARLKPGSALPIRPLILAGDDVCFVTAGSIGLECARIFLERLAWRSNCVDGIPYAACAGVALIHRKYPFHRAYNLAEELCASAKRFGAELSPSGNVSAMDWHIEFGQFKDSLKELRTEDYLTEDGCSLTLRPVAVLLPKEENIRSESPRTYEFFRRLCTGIQQKCRQVARGKIKELRTALKQGELESRFFLQDQELHGLFQGQDIDGISMDTPYLSLNGGTYCLLFDAIEMTDHYKILGEEEADG